MQLRDRPPRQETAGHQFRESRDLHELERPSLVHSLNIPILFSSTQQSPLIDGAVQVINHA